MDTHFRLVLLLASSGLSLDVAFARFAVTDADRIDPEERLSTESYNDSFSYRSPVAWDDWWAEHASGVRLSAGSLNIDRFEYIEEIKVAVGQDEDVAFPISAAPSRRFR